MQSTKMDIQNIRSNFPSLNRDQIFMDNAAGAQVVVSCIDSINEYLSNSNVQPGGRYPVSEEATAKVQAGYDAAAKHINASVEEVIFGASTTQLVRNVSTALKLQ